ncbi:MAG: hypothetical protein GVY16_11005 [Planctomycetes bacterium]|jgi:uncharacterized protein involved in exopolysaccharide biosynthesis|nr:hypothetical protein [Phycisphaerae bacterium]NBB96251.1 hypothetical protein [Planctomycetota bacterium]
MRDDLPESMASTSITDDEHSPPVKRWSPAAKLLAALGVIVGLLAAAIGIAWLHGWHLTH